MNWRSTKQMSTKIHIKNLSGSRSIGELQELFAAYGQVEDVKLIRRVQTGQCSGYVNMPDATAAAAAIAGLHGSSNGGLLISVREVQRRLMRRQRAHVGNGRSGGGTVGLAVRRASMESVPSVCNPKRVRNPRHRRMRSLSQDESRYLCAAFIASPQHSNAPPTSSAHMPALQSSGPQNCLNRSRVPD